MNWKYSVYHGIHRLHIGYTKFMAIKELIRINKINNKLSNIELLRKIIIDNKISNDTLQLWKNENIYLNNQSLNNMLTNGFLKGLVNIKTKKRRNYKSNWENNKRRRLNKNDEEEKKNQI